MASIPVALVFGHLTLVQLYIVSLLEGSLYVFFDLAETASLPRVVPKEQLPAAISQNQVTFGITNLLGPPLGGILYTLGRGYLLALHQNEVSDGESCSHAKITNRDCRGHEVVMAPTTPTSDGFSK